MQTTYSTKVQDLKTTYKEVSKYYKWEDTLKRYLISFIYTQNNKTFDVEEVKDFMKYIKSKTSFFSPYNKSKLLISTMLINNFDNYKEQFDKLLIQDKQLIELGFKSGKNLVRANMSLLLTSKEDEISNDIKKSYEIYKYMKRNHPFLTGEDDYALCMLISTSYNDINKQINIIENYYESLYNLGFKKRNSLQLLSHILSFSSEDITKNYTHLQSIGKVLRDNGINLNNNYYSSIAIMTLSYKEGIVEDIIEVYNELKSVREFKHMGVENNLVMATSLVMREYVTDEKLLYTIFTLCMEEIIKTQLDCVLFNGHDL